MLSGDIFEKVHFIACKVRYSEKPFGGVQLIVSGDFHQLPPVPDEVLVCPQCTGEIKGVRNTRSLVKVTCSSADCKHSWDPSTRYAFESPFWEKCQFKIVELTRVFRQDDVKLVHMLNEIRSGIYTKEAQEELNKCKRPLPDNDKIVSLIRLSIYDLSTDAEVESYATLPPQTQCRGRKSSLFQGVERPRNARLLGPRWYDN